MGSRLLKGVAIAVACALMLIGGLVLVPIVRRAPTVAANVYKAILFAHWQRVQYERALERQAERQP